MTQFKASVAMITASVFDDRFQEYVDLDGITVLQQYSKIKLEIQLEAGATDVATGQSELLLFQSAERPAQAATKDVSRYRLPRMPDHVEDALSRVKGLADVSEDLKRQIVNHIYYDLCSYTLYPGPLYAVAAEQLVAKYPKLRDGSCLKYEVWRAHLRVKAKNGRRAMESTVPGVGAARAKHQKASEAKQNSADARPAVAVQHIARHLSGVTYWGDAEDEDSVAGHLAFMAKEVRKANPDWQKIALSMERTFDERRHWMQSVQPLVADILAKYPALEYPQAIRQEFHLLTKHHLDTELEAAIKKYGKRVVTLAERKWRLKPSVVELHKRLDVLPEGEKDGCFATGVVSLLPRLLKEDAGSYLQKLDPSKVHMHPTVLFSGDSAFSADSFLGRKRLAVIERLVGLAFTQLTALGHTVVAQVVLKD
ncbi:uncharacterized protein LOC121837495 [Ixodes scapularis]|uniref:uncharacterized protein LOC121837495 n=1 Tax=Ixodes scapularis TaxID=6945 RepID=UPI001A9DF0A9|nr:uncharacterized protein LOC121837495 [Ixodes scapularis]